MGKLPGCDKWRATFWGTTELLMLQPVRELPALERLTLNGNIADLGTFLNRCPRLRLVTRLSPQEFAFMHLLDAQGTQYTNVDLPCFPRTTSVKIDVHNICFTRLLDGEFSKLDRLSLTGCIINDLGTLLSRCPRLRVLKVMTAMSRHDIKVHSASLQELVFGPHTECRGIEIVTPMLKLLKMEVQADKDIRVFISAPLLEMVSWRRSYTGSPIVFGVWHLRNLSLERRQFLRDKHLQNPSSDGQRMLANNHVLFLDMCASDSSDAELDFAQEIQKNMATDFSVLNLSLKTMGHAYGATLLQLFSVLQVHSAMKILKVNLLMSKKSGSGVTQACSENCPCDSPKIWRSQSICMTHLEEVEIKGIKGEDHEFDALKLILKCALLLKRMTVGLEISVKSYRYCTKEINNISLEYPSVDFHVYRPGTLVLHARSSCT
ncbi:uncharacterized protein [Aegilops tauschii subsp. strangulata]|uniref:uncharacterized protein n=1 Tax=Aegilops tauschii subsp. strangulata TaxID=200361 RepID=UPI003CC88947